MRSRPLSTQPNADTDPEFTRPHFNTIPLRSGSLHPDHNSDLIQRSMMHVDPFAVIAIYMVICIVVFSGLAWVWGEMAVEPYRPADVGSARYGSTMDTARL